jgi:anti-anti-sigma regulatory factor
MEIATDLSAGIPVVRVTGDMRLWGKQGLSDQFRETLHALMIGGARRVILNLSGVARIDSRGIGCLARCHATAITSNSEISLVLGPGFVLETLKQLNFIRLYPIYSDEATALTSVAAPRHQSP